MQAGQLRVTVDTSTLQEEYFYVGSTEEAKIVMATLLLDSWDRDLLLEVYNGEYWEEWVDKNGNSVDFKEYTQSLKP